MNPIRDLGAVCDSPETSPQIEPAATTTGAAFQAAGRPGFYLSHEFGLLLGIAIFITIFTAIDPHFVSNFNLFSLSRSAGIYALIGLAMMVVIVTGGLNLAIGAIGVCAAMTFGWAVEVLAWHWWLALCLALMLAAFLGWINGRIIVSSGIHSFVITLATMSIFFGAMIYLTQGQSFRGLPPEVSEFGRLKWFSSLSSLFIAALVVACLLALLYRYTVMGREMLAAGACAPAAEFSGIHARRSTMQCHMLSAVLAGLTGVLVTVRYGAAMPSMAGQLGQDWLMPAFLAPVLGGVVLSGGRAAVLGTVLGAVLVTTLTHGLLRLNIGEFWLQAILGCLLLTAVLGDRVRKHLLARRGLA